MLIASGVTLILRLLCRQSQDIHTCIHKHTCIYVTHIHTKTVFRNHDSSRSNSNPSLQGFFLAFPLFVSPFLFSEDSGSTNSNIFTHWLNLVTHLNSFSTVLPIPLQKAKPAKRSSVMCMLLPQMKVYSQILHL